MIRAYPHDPSVRPGETLTLCVSTTAPRFQVAFFRQGATLEPMGDLGVGPLPGRDVPEGPTQEDWGWPPHEFAIPADWPSGAYVAMLGEVGDDGTVSWPETATTAGVIAFVRSIVDLSIVTLSKAAGVQGGAVCGSRSLVDGLINFGRASIYSTSLSPALAAGISAARIGSTQRSRSMS